MILNEFKQAAVWLGCSPTRAGPATVVGIAGICLATLCISRLELPTEARGCSGVLLGFHLSLAVRTI